MLLLSRNFLACEASVSVRLSAGLNHFSLFERAETGASAKKLLPSVLRSPQFLRRQKAKNASQGEKNTETLATQATIFRRNG